MQENQRGSSPISGTSRAAGGPSTVLGHHPLPKPNAMAVIPINNISQSGHHRLINRLRSDIAADPLLPLIGTLLRQLDGAADRSFSHGMVRMKEFGVVTVPQILLSPKLVRSLAARRCFAGAYGGRGLGMASAR
jgi:hypothetical protein